MKVTNIKDKIYYSELIEFYNKNRRKIHRLLDVTENKNIIVNGKKYRVKHIKDMYMHYVYMIYEGELKEFYNIEENIYCFKYKIFDINDNGVMEFML